jgi:hypothetical protein
MTFSKFIFFCNLYEHRLKRIIADLQLWWGGPYVCSLFHVFSLYSIEPNIACQLEIHVNAYYTVVDGNKMYHKGRTVSWVGDSCLVLLKRFIFSLSSWMHDACLYLISWGRCYPMFLWTGTLVLTNWELTEVVWIKRSGAFRWYKPWD